MGIKKKKKCTKFTSNLSTFNFSGIGGTSTSGLTGGGGSSNSNSSQVNYSDTKTEQTTDFDFKYQLSKSLKQSSNPKHDRDDVEIEFS